MQKAENWLGKFGAYLGHFLCTKGSVLPLYFHSYFFLTGAYLVLDIPLGKLKKLFLGFLSHHFPIYHIWISMGVYSATRRCCRFEMNLFIQDYIGKTGTLLVLLFGIVLFLVFKIKMSPESFTKVFEKPQSGIK